MFKKIVFITFISILFSACASVPMETVEKSDKAKEFNPPTPGNAGLYIYRHGTFGGALKKSIWVNGKCVGESAPNVFFYEEVEGDKEHDISTQSEFSPNHLMVQTKSGQNYFVEQYIKMGAFVGGANLKLVDEEKGKQIVETLKLAKKGNCYKPE